MNKQSSVSSPALRETPGSWLLRFVKGAVIITGAVLPGISGGVLAVVLGIYEPMMRILGNLRRELNKKSIQFFLPIVLGMGVGLILFAWLLSALLDQYAGYVMWFFIGGIVGTLPSLYRTAGERGRKGGHWVVAAIFIVGTAWGLHLLNPSGQEAVTNNVAVMPTDSLWTWLFSGSLMGLGTVLPGLSPSNFLLFLGLLNPMMEGIKAMNMLVILPFGVGFVVCVLALAKLMNWLFARFHGWMYHAILGIVVGSTLVILPGDFYVAVLCAGIFVLGLAASLWMGEKESLKEQAVKGDK